MSNVIFFPALDTAGKQVYVGAYAIVCAYELVDPKRVQLRLADDRQLYLNMSFDQFIADVNQFSFTGFIIFIDPSTQRRIGLSQYDVLTVSTQSPTTIVIGSEFGPVEVIGTTDDYNNQVTNNLY